MVEGEEKREREEREDQFKGHIVVHECTSEDHHYRSESSRMADMDSWQECTICDEELRPRQEVKA